MTQPEKNSQSEENILPENTGSTTHELVKHQIEDYDYHVTDEDMENMEISTDLSDDEKIESEEEAEDIQEDKAGTSYDVLD